MMRVSFTRQAAAKVTPCSLQDLPRLVQPWNHAATGNVSGTQAAKSTPGPKLPAGTVVLTQHTQPKWETRARSDAELHKRVSSQMKMFDSLFNNRFLRVFDSLAGTNLVLLNNRFLRMFAGTNPVLFNNRFLPLVYDSRQGVGATHVQFVPRRDLRTGETKSDSVKGDAFQQAAAGKFIEKLQKNGFTDATAWRRGGLATLIGCFDGHYDTIKMHLYRNDGSVGEALAREAATSYLPCCFHDDRLQLGQQTVDAVSRGRLVVVEKERGKNLRHAEAIRYAFNQGFDVALPEFPLDQVQLEALKYGGTAGMLLMGHLLVHVDKRASEAGVPSLRVCSMEIVNETAERDAEVPMAAIERFSRALISGESEFEVNVNDSEKIADVLRARLPFTYNEVNEYFKSMLPDKNGTIDMELITRLQTLCGEAPEIAELVHKVFTPAAAMRPADLTASPPVNRHTRYRELNLHEHYTTTVTPLVQRTQTAALQAYAEAEKKALQPSFGWNPEAWRDGLQTVATPCQTFADLYAVNKQQW